MNAAFFSLTRSCIRHFLAGRHAQQNGVLIVKPISFLLTALAATVAVATPMSASAAPWQNINQRQARLDARIDQGVRSGALNRNEAQRLRTDYRSLARLETSYRQSGHSLTVRERNDLDHRFDALSARIKVQKHDRQTRH